MLAPTNSTAVSDVLDAPFVPATGAEVIRGDVAERPTRLEPLLSVVERGLDFLTVIAAVYVSYSVYRMVGAGKQVQYPAATVLLGSAGFALLFVLLLERHGGYRTYLSLLGVRETERILRVTLESLLVALLVAYLTATTLPRLVFSSVVITVPLLLTLQKWEMYNATRKLHSIGYATRRAVIFGADILGKRIYSTLLRSPKFGLEPIAFVDDDPQKTGLEIYPSSYQRKRSASVLAGPVCPELLRELKASVLVIATTGFNRDAIRSLVTRLSAEGISTYFVPEDFSGPGYWIDYVELDGLMLAHLSKGRGRLVYETVKRFLDLSFSIALLPIFAALFVVLAALVKSTSVGPVLFRQNRVGKDGRIFRILKFRTMYCDSPVYGYSPTAGKDRRVTPVGRFLRRSSLDELPQILNVLSGDMSLVGPRPEMPFLVEQYTPLQRQRLAVKPEITGLWQLSADRASLIHENIEYDLYYISDCIEGLLRLMASDYRDPLNLGTSELVTIDNLVDMICAIAGKRLVKHHDLSRPQGVRGRNSDNSRLISVLGWEPRTPLRDGLTITYRWIENELRKANRLPASCMYASI